MSKFPKSSPWARICKHSSSILKLDTNKTWNTTVTPASGSTCFKLVGGVDLFKKNQEKRLVVSIISVFWDHYAAVLSKSILLLMPFIYNSFIIYLFVYLFISLFSSTSESLWSLSTLDI